MMENVYFDPPKEIWIRVFRSLGELDAGAFQSQIQIICMQSAGKGTWTNGCRIRFFFGWRKKHK